MPPVVDWIWPPVRAVFTIGVPATAGMTDAVAVVSPTATPRPNESEPPEASAVAVAASVEPTEISPLAFTKRTSA